MASSCKSFSQRYLPGYRIRLCSAFGKYMLKVNKYKAQAQPSFGTFTYALVQRYSIEQAVLTFSQNSPKNIRYGFLFYIKLYIQNTYSKKHL